MSDPTARPDFQRRVHGAKRPSYWWQFLRDDGWVDDYLQDVRAELTRRGETFQPTWEKPHFETDWAIAAIIINLEPSTAERLIDEHWRHVRYERLFVQTALFVATRKCRELAAEAIAACPIPSELFRHIGFQWRIGGREERHRLSTDRLDAILPYLDLLDDSAIHDLWSACNTDRFFEWRRQHLDARLSDTWRPRCGLHESDLWADLDRIAEQSNRPLPDFWIEEFGNRGEDRRRALEVAQRWLVARGTIRALEVAAACVAVAANRADLDILDVPGAPAGLEADAIRADARFAVFSRSLS